MRRRRLLVLGLAVMAALVGGALVYTHFFSAPERSAETLLECLPGDTETVWVARGPFNAIVPPADVDPSRLSLILEQGTIAMLGIQEGVFWHLFTGRVISLAVDGSRKFRPPTDLGAMRYEGASIIQFEKAFGFEIFNLRSAMARGAKEVKTMHGIDVACFEEKWEADLWTVLIAVPCSNVVVVGTDAAYVNDVIGALRELRPAAQPHEFFLDSLQRSKNARAWLARRYDTVSASEDPSSPLREQPGEVEPDPQARGMLAVQESTEGVKVTYFSTNPDAVGVVSRNWSKAGIQLMPKAVMTIPGEVDLYLPEDPASEPLTTLMLLSAFGHGVYP